MRLTWWIVESVIAALLMLGCERAPVASPATAPAEQAPAARAPASTTLVETEPPEPSIAHMLIDHQRIEFPPAKLVVRPKSGQLLAILYSDDPPAAIDDSYTGNSFYLEMTLEISDASMLSTARWIHKSPTSDRSDTISGIFLDGRKRHLQPFDVIVEFDSTTTPAKVWLRGHFLLFEPQNDPSTPGQIIPVAAELDADLVVRSAGR